MTKKLLLLSGGLDSVTLAAELSAANELTRALFIDRGQTNLASELKAVAYFEAKLKIDLQRTNLSSWRDSWINKGVTDKQLPRNAMFVLAALPFSRQAKCDEIILGSNLDDTGVPDGSPAFIKAMNGLLEACKQPERVVAPFLDRNMKKTDVAALALQLLGREDAERTWTCWSSGETPCGTCLACKSRDEALAPLAGK